MANLPFGLRNRREPDFPQRISIFRHNFLLDGVACPKNAAAKLAIGHDIASSEQQTISRNSSNSGGTISVSSQ
jgi:hypothetical protein